MLLVLVFSLKYPSHILNRSSLLGIRYLILKYFEVWDSDSVGQQCLMCKRGNWCSNPQYLRYGMMHINCNPSIGDGRADSGSFLTCQSDWNTELPIQWEAAWGKEDSHKKRQPSLVLCMDMHNSTCTCREQKDKEYFLSISVFFIVAFKKLAWEAWLTSLFLLLTCF